MTTYLADANLLIALTVSDHVHHSAATNWFGTEAPNLATCPLTQGTLLRFLIRQGHSAAGAIGVLEVLMDQEWHRFIADSLPFDSDHLRGVIGHRQVTDAYLAALANRHDVKLATLDKGLSSLHSEVALLIDVTSA